MNMKVSSNESELNDDKSFLRRMSYLGFTLGIALIALALVVDVVVAGKAFRMEVITKIYSENVVQWIILTSPVFLTIVFYVLGKMIAERERKIDNQLSNEKHQFKLIENFIDQLERGNLNATVATDFINKNLASQLEEFRDKLRTGKEEEERRLWENQGLAQLGEILRRSNGLDEMSEQVLRFLVRYLDCNQGSVFVLNDLNEELLDLRSCYAFDKRKFLSKQIGVGQGLVGQCFLERETILLYDVPHDYVKITSGLGLATPRCVVIVPLKYNENVTGVIEVASFSRLESYQVKFLEKCGEAFSAIIDSARVNQNMKQLLKSSQQQTEELRSQEEEMRQNIEELQAIQEQVARQLEENTSVTAKLEAREKVLGLTTILSESDLYGTITYVNEKFCAVSQYHASELIGKPHNVVRHPDMPGEIFKLMWSTIKKGQTFRGIVKNRKKDGSHYWVDATIVPIFENGKIVKYIGARYHIEDEAFAQKAFEDQLERLGLVEVVEV